MSLKEVTGVGSKTIELFKKLSITTKEELLRYYPYKYEIIRKSDIKTLNNGDKIVIDGIIEGQPVIIYIHKKLKKIIFRITTKEAILNVAIYNQTYLFKDLKYGKTITIIGKYDKNKNTVIASDIRFERLADNSKIEAKYHTTANLKTKNISKYIKTILNEGFKYKTLVPEYINNKYNFTSYEWALNQIHFPVDVISLKRARQQLKYEELFTYLLKIKYLKRRIMEDENAISRSISTKDINNFIKNLPFCLTEDQLIVIDEILDDMCKKKRMNRLLQGDVGSGKTIVAFIAIYANYLSNYQSALMAPTEILAKQHYEEAVNILGSYGIKIELLTGSTTKKKKETILKDLKNNEIDLLIGTHSLIQNEVIFSNLGLIITDEQHRFGVNQRNDLKEKAISPDILSMSATPIPRTYALTIYGDTDVSNIKTKPQGRKEVITYFKTEKDITDILNMMKIELDNKHQIYVITPSIDNEDDDELESVSKMEKKMNKAFGKLYKVSSIHGKMSAKEKEEVMNDFINNKSNILISTTVIEVGVNVANASMIVIFNANMFGLSTLHQLRGRVGRSDIQSYCLLVADKPYKQLEMMERCNDGFAISQYDFENRGEGDLFGYKQSGLMNFNIANVNRDYNIMLKAKEDADEVIDLLLDKNNSNYNYILEELKKIDNLE